MMYKENSIIGKTVIAILLLLLSAYGGQLWRSGEMEVEVTIRSETDIYVLDSLQLKGEIYRSAGYGYFYVNPTELKSLKDAGIPVKIIVEDLQKRSDNFWDDSRATYKSYDEIIALMDNLVETYPEICSKTVYGESVDARELSALKISDNVSADEAEPEILFDGGIHGDELGGPENLALFAQFLCESYSSDSEIKELIDSREIWLFIMVNPDGHVAVSRSNANGVDLNRNWGYMWNKECNTASGFSQPETRAIRDCMLENQFTVNISNHSGIEAIFIPWCYTSTESPGFPFQKELADTYLDVSGYSYFQIIQSNLDYATTGETVDFAYGVLGTDALTMELSRSKQPSNATEIYNKNKPAMIHMIKQAGYGISGKVIDKESGAPVAARIYLDEMFPIYSDPQVGDYHDALSAGTYSMRIEANGYESHTVGQISVGSDTSLVLQNLELVPTQDSLTYADRVVYMRKCSGLSYNLLGKEDGKEMTLGNQGEVVLDMQFPLVDKEGDDITVYGSGSYALSVSNSIDGKWTSLGSGNGESTFDLALSDNESNRYVKITGSASIDAVSSGSAFTTSVIGSKKMQFAMKPTCTVTSNILQLQNPGSRNYTLKITSISGRVLLQESVSTSTRIDISGLSHGVYIMQLNGAGISLTKSFVHK